MANAQPRIGLHVPLRKGMVKAADRAGGIGAAAVQVFTDNPTAWRRRAQQPDDLPAFRDRLAALSIAPVAVHAAYLVNLAGSDEEFHRRSIQVLAAELRAAAEYGAAFVNTHIGSHLGAGPDEGVARIVRAVSEALAETGDVPDRPMLVLENSAGGGNGFGTTADELGAIFEALDAAGIPAGAVGLCLDTAHLWGAGVPLDDEDELDRFLVTLDRRVGLDRLVMGHLNDSKSEPGSRADRHEHIGGGRIGERGLGNVLRHPAFAGRPFFLETPGMEEGYDEINLRRARAILTGEPLEPLPPEAFALRGSRSRSAP